jgi:SH3-like domain-containing protein
MIDGRRTVRVLASPAPLRKKPAADARVEAMITPRALANLEKCEGDWCRISLQGRTGWVLSSQVWGVAPAAQCR